MLKTTQTDKASIKKKKDHFSVDYTAETIIFDNECEKFMKKFVKDIFSPSSTITQEVKSQFGLLCQHGEARSWFSTFVDAKRVDFKEVEETTFFRLVQYFAIVLFECHLSDDFAPATKILNMAFTFCHISGFKGDVLPGKSDSPVKQYVYHFLKDQDIWKSNRFWTSAFLFAVDGERKKRVSRGSWRSLNKEEQLEHNSTEENSAFGHLGSFLYMMKAMELEKSLIDEFLMKISTIENLHQDRIQELIDSVEVIE